MTTEFIMTDGTHIRVNDEDADQMPADWTRIGELTDSTQFVGLHSIEDSEPEPEPEAEPEPEPKELPKAKAKVVEGPKEKH
jgi:hypothetical protein